MTASVRTPLAELAAVVLLVALFLALAVATVALYLLARGLRKLTSGFEAQAPRAVAAARQLEVASRELAQSAIEPQIRLASSIVGLRAGLRTLLRGPRR